MSVMTGVVGTNSLWLCSLSDSEAPESAATVREQEDQYNRVNEKYLKSIEMSGNEVSCHKKECYLVYYTVE